MKPIQLSACDWQEIAATLYTKIDAIKSGDYGDGETEDENDNWVRHLQAIVDAIGEDGDKAIINGVAPSGDYQNPVCKHEENLS